MDERNNVRCFIFVLHYIGLDDTTVRERLKEWRIQNSMEISSGPLYKIASDFMWTIWTMEMRKPIHSSEIHSFVDKWENTAAWKKKQ